MENLERELAAFKSWHERDFLKIVGQVERILRTLFGDERSKKDGGLVDDVEELKKVTRLLERLITIAIVTNIFQLVLILILFFLAFRYPVQ